MPPVSRSLLAVITFGVLAFPGAGTAQKSLSLNGGATFATLSTDGVTAHGPRTNTGSLTGASLGLPLSGRFGIAPGIYYVQKGSTVEAGQEYITFKFDLDLAYLEVPVLGVLNLTGAFPVGVTLFAGPSVAFEVSCTFERQFIASPDDDRGVYSAGCDEGRERKIDFSAMFGAGLSFPFLSNVDVVFNGGLDRALAPIDSGPYLEVVRTLDEVDGLDPVTDVKNTAWFLMGGFRFPLGG